MILGLHQTQEHGYRLEGILSIHSRSSMILSILPHKENDPMDDSLATITLNDLNIMDRTGYQVNSRFPE